MTSSSGESQTTSTQPYILSGPTVQAAQEAAQAQVQAAEEASATVTANTSNAINALMGEYGTALQYAQPSINTGNQALAQMNYMLGMPAVNPGQAPTAPGAGPTSPTLASIEKSISPTQVKNYINENTGSVSNGVRAPNGGNAGNSTQQNYQNYQYTGYGSDDPTLIAAAQAAWNQDQMGSGGVHITPPTYPGGLVSSENTIDQSGALGSQIFGSSALNQDVRSGLAQEQLDDPNSQANLNYLNQQQAYNQQVTTYGQDLNAYNNQENLYNAYNSKGPATAANISDLVTNLPGFQFQQQEGLSSIQNAASASGMLNSGALLQNLNQFGQQLASTYYGNYLSQLGGIAGAGQQATSNVMAGANSLGNSLASSYANEASGQANADLAEGQAMASSFLTPVANQQVRMFPYTTTSDTQSSQSGSAMSGISQGLGLLGGLFSSRELKEANKKINVGDILDRVSELSIEKWKYKGINQEHLGPYAEEFKELFGVGDGQTINIIDMFGVTLAAIKALTQKINQLEKE